MEADELVVEHVTEASTLTRMYAADQVSIDQFEQEFTEWLDSDHYSHSVLDAIAVGVSENALRRIFRIMDEFENDLDDHIMYIIQLHSRKLLGTRRDLDKLRSFMALFDHSDNLRERIRNYLDVFFCADCDDHEYQSKFQDTWQDEPVCRSCIASDYTYSHYHEVWINDNYIRHARDRNDSEVLTHEESESFEWSDERDCYVHLDHPYHSNNYSKQLIGNYHSSKSGFELQFDEWTKKNNRWFGVELEVMHNDGLTDAAAQIIHECVNDDGDEPVRGLNMFFERDGSLGSSGFEMITQPMSLPAHRKLWSFLQDKTKVRGLRSHKTNNCGLHVHVSRTGLSKLQIAKLVTFVNNPSHADFILAIARRYENGYCNIKPKKIGKAAQSNDRYEAVNLTPRHTIEFRLFKGTLKYESLIAAVEFTHALIEFCKPTQTSITDLTADAFMRFMEEKIPHETEFVRPYIKNNLQSE